MMKQILNLIVSLKHSCPAAFRTATVILLAAIRTASIAQTCTPVVSSSLHPNGFVAFSVSVTPAATYTLQWNFGNNTFLSASTLTASAQYTNNGTYTVNVTIFTSLPTCSSTAAYTLLVNNICTATPNFSWTTGPYGQVFFSNLSSGSVSGTTYFWDFGNGQTSSQTSPNITYTANTTYTVKLYMTNSTTPLCIDSISQSVTVSNVCNLLPDFTYTQQPNGQILFTNTSTGTVATSSYTWNFGDGGNSSLTSPTHTYAQNGSYTIQLLVNNNTSPSCISTKTLQLLINTYTCNASFIYSAGSNGTINFTSTSVPATGSTYYNWTFGAVNYTAIGNQQAAHTYTANGTQTVTLYFVTSGGCNDTIVDTITVNNVNPCQLSAGFSFSQTQQGSVTFSNTSTGTVSGTGYLWNFGSGSATSTAVSPSYIFPANGFYTVMLTATHPTIANCSSSISHTILVNTYLCNIKAVITHTLTQSGNVIFENNDTTSAGFYFWKFGDGTTGQGKTTSHIYANGGTHYVLHKVVSATDPQCSDSIVQAINVTGVPCTANAGFQLYPASLPQHWHAVPSYPWNVSAANWSWGDGTTSNGMYASHTYTASGNYNICLTVTASCGSTATACSSYSVYRSGGTLYHVNVVSPATVVLDIAEDQWSGAELNLYPNPVEDFLVLSVTNFEGNIDYVISDALGRTVQRGSASSYDPGGKKIDLSDQPPGLYMIRLSIGGENITRKLILGR